MNKPKFKVQGEIKTNEQAGINEAEFINIPLV